MPGSMQGVEPQLTVVALVALGAGGGLEDRAVGHLAGVDVQAHRDGIIAGVADGVVLVRRDQTARRARAGLDRADRLETPLAVLVGKALVLHYFERTAPHAFDAPHAAVIVDRRALAGAPGHRHHAVTVF